MKCGKLTREEKSFSLIKWCIKIRFYIFAFFSLSALLEEGYDFDMHESQQIEINHMDTSVLLQLDGNYSRPVLREAIVCTR